MIKKKRKWTEKIIKQERNKEMYNHISNGTNNICTPKISGDIFTFLPKDTNE